MDDFTPSNSRSQVAYSPAWLVLLTPHAHLCVDTQQKSRFTQDVHLHDRVFELNSLLRDILSAVIEELETMFRRRFHPGGE